ncbi:MAG: DUF1361 domain-containing protein [bacterium]|nr:DUF1361 domain-containing protein [bacterium]
MDIFLHNFGFIGFNSFLALISIALGYLMIRTRHIFLKILYEFLWLIFLPNTIYILTDVSHLFEDWPKVNSLFKAILTVQYGVFAIFGIITFVIAVYFFQKLLEKGNKKKIRITTFIAIFILNLAVGFAVVLGGIKRSNSWYIFTDPIRVINDSLEIIYSQELLILSIGIGLLANAIYFLLAEPTTKYFKRITFL